MIEQRLFARCKQNKTNPNANCMKKRGEQSEEKKMIETRKDANLRGNYFSRQREETIRKTWSEINEIVSKGKVYESSTK